MKVENKVTLVKSNKALEVPYTGMRAWGIERPINVDIHMQLVSIASSETPIRQKCFPHIHSLIRIQTP
jgi:hypothetical protein